MAKKKTVDQQLAAIGRRKAQIKKKIVKEHSKLKEMLQANPALGDLLKTKTVFEHVPVEQTPYDRISKRVMDATSELNNALQEAHECAEMRVFLGMRDRTVDHAMRFDPLIYRMTHSTMTLIVKIADKPQMEWRQVKDPRFKDAAGVGLGALDRKQHAQGVPGKS